TCVIHGECCLGQVSNGIIWGNRHFIEVRRLLNHSSLVDSLPERALDLLVSPMTDKHDCFAFRREPSRLEVNFGDEGTGRIDNAKIPFTTATLHFRRHAMCGQYADRSPGDRKSTRLNSSHR